MWAITSPGKRIRPCRGATPSQPATRRRNLTFILQYTSIDAETARKLEILISSLVAVQVRSSKDRARGHHAAYRGPQQLMIIDRLT